MATTLIAALLVTQAGQVAATAETVKPIQPGVKVPNVTVRTLENKEAKLADTLKGKRTVLIFYRGGWCPFCNKHLSELGAAKEQFTKMGFQVVAISPDTPSELTKTLDKSHLDYTLVSDSKADAMKAFGVAYRMPDETFSTYKNNYNIDVEAASGQNHHILPVPALFLIDEKGMVRFTHSNPDIRVRMSAQEVIDAASKLTP